MTSDFSLEISTTYKGVTCKYHLPLIYTDFDKETQLFCDSQFVR